ncbi:flippase-like domain-containing protein [archaeon]|jgi:glycosyltransferase 2 family protein|nr:flippase-like domain-containing protein [archaeon]MBT4022831.1 flippase-like domain-containing protein [archaeon]MBT4272975.1 flippase-like domain-containing protein [archaeon]MBT4460934.1 flippase-like domain-containing protein [archaeon]MBT4858038.1 flippase-like domain-containing protein [archaeon]
MKKKTKIMVISLLVGFFLIYLNYKKFGINEVIDSFRNFNLSILPYYLGVIVCLELLGTFRWSIVIKAFKFKVPYFNLFFYRMSGYAVGYLSPQAHIGGEPVRALLLKRNGINFKQGISTILIDKTMLLVTDIVFILTAAIMMFLHYSISNNIKIIFSVILTGVIILVGTYFHCMFTKKPFFSAIFNITFWRHNKKIKKIRKEIEEIEHTIHTFYKKHFRYFFVVVAIQMIMYLLMFLEYYFALALFNFAPNPFVVFMLMGAVAISYSMPVPMALGVLETSQVSALSMLNMERAIGLSISLLVRAKDLLRTLIGGLALLYFGVIEGLFKKTKSENEKSTIQFI